MPWTEYFTPRGEKYYINTLTRKTLWYNPDEPTPGLPYGWSTKKDQYGQVYYTNHIGAYNTFTHPLTNKISSKTGKCPNLRQCWSDDYISV